MKSKYSFGGIVFAIESGFALEEKPELAAFRTDDSAPADFIIKAVIDDTSSAILREENRITVPIKAENSDKTGVLQLLLRAQAAWLMLEKDAFVLHASYTVTDGRALLITAPSGTGKSTLAEHWINTVGGEIINGDRVLITKTNGSFYANGIYVSGTSGICHNVTAPIGLITLLEQGKQNKIVPLRAHELFMRIVCQCSYDEKDPASCAEITSLVADLINCNDVCCYSCTNSHEAAEELEKLKWTRK